MAKIKVDIQGEIVPLGNIDSSNKQNVLAFASWNDADHKFNIRQYHTIEKMLLKGIQLNHEEAENLLYALLTHPEMEYDKDKVAELIDNGSKTKRKAISIDELVDELEEDEDFEEKYSRDDETGGIKIELK